MASKRKIIVVLGPTAGGKSGVALALAKKLGGFLISADSRQVFKHMDIGTNKDKGDWRNGIFYLTGALRPFDKLRAGEAQRDKCYIREYMIDVVEPDEPFSVGDWVESVKKILKKEKDQAIVVGGTGLYVSALTEGYELPGKFDAKLRARLEKQVAKYGWPYLINKMKKFDPNIEKKIDVKNPRRVIRAAEIVLQTKKSLKQGKGESQFEFLKIGLDVPREKLYEKINARVDAMVKEGLIDEVKRLLAQGYKKDSSAMSGIGYRQIGLSLNGEITLAQAVELVKRDTRRYAKRQMTWFRRDGSIRWVKNSAEAQALVEKFVRDLSTKLKTQNSK